MPLTAGSAAALVGALMFLFSDSMLALDRFRRPSPCHGLDHEQLLRGPVPDRRLPGGLTGGQP